MTPVVSTVIPAYNAAPWLGAAIESALAQDVNQEILVIDDGSTDPTAQVAARYPSPVRLISKANGGVSSARNLGLELARGEYVAFLDADDVWHKDKLAKQISVFERFPVAGTVVCDEQHIDSSGTIIKPSFFATRAFVAQLPTADALLAKPFTWLAMESFFPTSGVMTRRLVAKKAGSFDPALSLVEDRDYWIRLAGVAPVAMTPRVLLDYRCTNASSLSRVKEVVWAKNLMFVLDRHRDLLCRGITNEGEDPDAILAAIYLHVAHVCWHAGDLHSAKAAFGTVNPKSLKDLAKSLLCRAAVAVGRSKPRHSVTPRTVNR